MKPKIRSLAGRTITLLTEPSPESWKSAFFFFSLYMLPIPRELSGQQQKLENSCQMHESISFFLFRRLGQAINSYQLVMLWHCSINYFISDLSSQLNNMFDSMGPPNITEYKYYILYHLFSFITISHQQTQSHSICCSYFSRSLKHITILLFQNLHFLCFH